MAFGEISLKFGVISEGPNTCGKPQNHCHHYVQGGGGGGGGGDGGGGGGGDGGGGGGGGGGGDDDDDDDHLYRGTEYLTKAVQIAPIVIGAIGIVTEDFLHCCERVPKFEWHLIRTRQVAATLATAYTFCVDMPSKLSGPAKQGGPGGPWPTQF